MSPSIAYTLPTHSARIAVGNAFWPVTKYFGINLAALSAHGMQVSRKINGAGVAGTIDVFGVKVRVTHTPNNFHGRAGTLIPL